MTSTQPLATQSNRPLGGRTVVLGLDSVDLLLVQRWAAQGELPFLAKLIENGPLVRLAALSRVLQGALWPSLLTGLDPGQHGLYYHNQLTNGTYQIDGMRADRVTAERFYEQLGAHGVRSAIVDVPADLPAANFNGLQIVDWGAEFQFWHFETRPATLKQEIEAQFGSHLFTDYGRTGDSPASHLRLSAKLEEAVRVKTTLIRQLLERPDLDLIFAVYGEPHKAGHFFWKYMDPSHPDHVETEAALEGALLRLYRLIDAELASLAGQLRPEDNLIVLSDHGMQACYRGEHFLGAILDRLELGKSATASQLGGPFRPSLTDRVLTRTRRALRRALERILPAQAASMRQRFGEAAKIDWSETLAFGLPTDRNSYIRINLHGREPQGIVTPGREYAALLDRIEREFRALINAETGEPAVEEVFRVHEIYPGPRADDLPDIAILWRADAPINVLESPAIGRLEIRVAERRSGNHRAEGFLLARGPAFRTGRAEIHGDLMQIAPTFLALHGVPVPTAYKHAPLAAILSDRAKARLGMNLAQVADQARAL
jgi:predicted AlkP superfamily phosphohydrolase/phosphomutase